MKIFHSQYGVGSASEPFLDGGIRVVQVEFACGVRKFIYPDAFNSGIIAELDSKKMQSINNTHDDNFKLRLHNLMKKYVEDFKEKANFPFVVSNSIPIIWFGDINEYIKSKLKVVTIGLNPSDKEFPVENGRFNFVELDEDVTGEGLRNLEETLNQYFYKNPYKWFNKYDRILSFVNSSYHSENGSAIHIDVCSAIATNPTWGKLGKKEKKIIENEVLFKELFSLLQPHLVFASIGRSVFEKVFYDWNFVLTENFPGNNYIDIYKKGESVIINGTNMKGVPFGGIKEEYVKNIVSKIFKG